MSAAVLPSQQDAGRTTYRVLFAIGLVHLFNDAIQAVIPAIYPIVKESMQLTYTQLGWIGFALSFTASLIQPLVGLYSDARPSPYLLPLGMVSTFSGMLALAYAPNYAVLLLSVILVGIGSAVFHPEASRVAYLAAGPRRGLAQSIYQVGGNGGQSLAPLMTALIFYPLGQRGALWFTLVAAASIAILAWVAAWYSRQLTALPKIDRTAGKRKLSVRRTKELAFAIVLLIFLVFARSWYSASISNYFVFDLISRFNITAQSAQYYIFCFLAAGALGTFIGGPLADRFGRRNLLFFSMLGALPFALIVPYAGPGWTYALLFFDGLIITSSFSVAVVYAQDLIPGKVGTASGLILGLAFGMGAVGAVALGKLIDLTSLEFVMKACSFLPLLGLLTIFLPSDRKLRSWAEEG